MTRIHELVDLLKQAPDEVFVQPHNVPDPDAIASSSGLSQLLTHLGVPNVIVYENEMEKANSVTMLRAFGIELHPSAEVHTMGAGDWTVLVDVPKENSNLTDRVTDEVACIDHHQYDGPKGYRFEDVRPDVGSCSTIIAQYLQDADVEPSPAVATALIDDLKANQMSRADLQDYARAFESVEIYGEVGFLRLENANDSLLGAASDIVITIAGVNVVVSYSIRARMTACSNRIGEGRELP